MGITLTFVPKHYAILSILGSNVVFREETRDQQIKCVFPKKQSQGKEFVEKAEGSNSSGGFPYVQLNLF